MRIFKVLIGGEIACYCMTENEEFTIKRFMDDITHNPDEHQAVMLEDINNGASVEIIEED